MVCFVFTWNMFRWIMALLIYELKLSLCEWLPVTTVLDSPWCPPLRAFSVIHAVRWSTKFHYSLKCKVPGSKFWVRFRIGIVLPVHSLTKPVRAHSVFRRLDDMLFSRQTCVMRVAIWTFSEVFAEMQCASCSDVLPPAINSWDQSFIICFMYFLAASCGCDHVWQVARDSERRATPCPIAWWRPPWICRLRHCDRVLSDYKYSRSLPLITAVFVVAND